jgi:diguanylate cyclase (GGDEF)-like protein
MEKVGRLLREKIAIVETARVQRAMAAQALARAGYATVQIDNSPKTLKTISIESPDLVILDALMSDFDGLEVCRSLKSNRFTRHIPIVIVASRDSSVDQFRWIGTGADDYLREPFAPEQLIGHVRVLLSQRVHYDSVTKLPTGAYLQSQIDARLAQNLPTAIIFVDVDHFRAYTEAKGREAANRVLLDLGKLMVETLPLGNVFAGHLGGDDFVAVLPPESADTFIQTLLDRFKAMNSDLDKWEIAPRTTQLPKPPLPKTRPPTLSLSIACVTNERRALVNYVQVSNLLSEAMSNLKSKGGGKSVRV